MKVSITPRAQSDSRIIWTYIARDSVEYANAMLERFIKAYQQMARFPHSGRPTRFENIRETIVGPFIVQYRVSKNSVEILRIRHGKQLF